MHFTLLINKNPLYVRENRKAVGAEPLKPRPLLDFDWRSVREKWLHKLADVPDSELFISLDCIEHSGCFFPLNNYIFFLVNLVNVSSLQGSVNELLLWQQ